MRKERFRLWLVALATLFAGSALGQAPKITNLELEDQGFPESVVEFEVRTASGAIVENLTEPDVFVLEDGNRVSGVLTRASLAGGATFVIAVDTSGSMKPILPAISEALVEFTGNLDTKDRVAVLAFDDNVRIPVPFTGDRAKITQGLEALETRGITTVLFYGVYKALDLFQERGLPDRKVLLLISDGLDEGSAYTIDDCVRLASAHDVKILALGVPFRDGPQLSQPQRAARISAPLNLEKLSEESGGFFLRAAPKPDWSAQLETLVRAATAQWSFAWTSGLPTDGKQHDATLSVRLADLTLSAPLTLQTTLVESEMAVLPPVSPPEDSLLEEPPATEVEPESETVEPAEPWWSDPILLAAVVGGGLLLLLLIVIAWFAFSRRSDSEPLDSDEEELGDELTLGQPIVPVSAPPTSAPEPAAGDAKPSAGADDEEKKPPPHRDKRRTVFAASGSTYPVYKSASFEVKSGSLAGSNLTLLEGRTTLGRDDDNHIVLEHEKVSLHHAEIAKREGTYWLEDLGSTNGTYVGNQRLRSTHPLEDGEQISLGGVLLIFRARA